MPISPMQESYVTITELCELLRVSDAAVVKWIHQGKIPAPFRVGNTRRWPRSVIEAWLSQREGGAA